MNPKRLATAPSYKNYVQRKRRDGEKPLPRDQWESRLKGKADEKSKDETGTEDEGAGMASKLKGLFSKIKAAPLAIMEAAKKAPAEVQKILVDSDHRRQAMRSMADVARKAPEKILAKVLDSAKAEIHEMRHAAKAVHKLAKGGKLDSKDKKALYSAAVTIAGAVMAGIPPGTALMAAGAIGKGFAIHVGMGAASHLLNDGFLHFEAAESGGHAIHHLMELVATTDDLAAARMGILAAAESEDEDKMAESVAAYVTAHAIGQLGKGIDDKAVQGILSGDVEKDLAKATEGDDVGDKAKKAAAPSATRVARHFLASIQMRGL